MTARVALSALVCTCALAPAPLAAQTTIDGSGEWTVANNTSHANGQSNGNGSFLQNYSLGYTSSLWDPRLVRFNAAGLFRTVTLTSHGDGRDDERGRQGDLGYKLGASLLPASSLPFFIQASRTTSNSSGELGPSNPIRSGLVAPSGAPPVDFEALNSVMNVGWQVGLGALPRLELGYRGSSTLVTGGDYRAEQRDADLSASLSKDIGGTHQTLRYQRTSTETLLADSFAQRLNNLDYDLGATLTHHLRLTAHAGRRMTFVRSDVASLAPDPGADAYTPPPSFGETTAQYGLAGVAYEPNGRFMLRLDGTIDRQSGGGAETRNRLATMTSHIEVLRGLRFSASGTTGTRQQLVSSDLVTVSTRASVVGVTYQTSVRWLSGSVSATQGLGLNSTLDGRRGESRSWSRDGNLSARIRRVNLGAGYERTHNRDDLLDFGNLDTERIRASAQLDGRMTISVSGEQLRTRRGRLLDAERHHQETVSATASVRIWRETTLAATAGGFSNTYASTAIGPGRDRTLFWTVGGQAGLFSAVRVLGWLRQEAATAARTGFDQQALSSFVRVEYRLRTLGFAVEYRQNSSLTQYAVSPDIDRFAGRQVRFSIIRQFGMALR